MRDAMFGKFEERLGGVKIRSRDISRLEGMTDAAIGLAITLLIISQDVPNTYAALIDLLWAMPAFALTFLLTMMIWYWHNRFFRRYGLINGEVMLLSGLLIFLVLAFVFPMKYLTSVVINLWLFNTVLGIGPLFNTEGLTYQDAVTVHIIYVTGFAAVFYCFSALYNAALRQSQPLDLDPQERVETRSARLSFAVVASVGLLTIIPALTVPAPYAPLVAGWCMMLIWPAQSFAVKWFRPKYQREAGYGTAPTP